MKIDQITDVLLKQAGGKKDGGAIVLPHESEVTMFVALVGETLTIPRVEKVEPGDLVIAHTTRGERYVFAADDVRAFKLDATPVIRRERGAGFGKQP